MLNRKTVTLVEDYEYICQTDDAVHQDDPEFDLKWEQYLDGQGPPPLIPGGKPTVFRLRHLGTVAKSRLARYMHQAQADENRWQEALVAAFALGVSGVESFTGKDGKPLRLKSENDEGIAVLSVETVDEFDLETVLEVGGRVLSRMAPSPK